MAHDQRPDVSDPGSWWTAWPRLVGDRFGTRPRYVGDSGPGSWVTRAVLEQRTTGTDGVRPIDSQQWPRQAALTDPPERAEPWLPHSLSACQGLAVSRHRSAQNGPGARRRASSQQSVFYLLDADGGAVVMGIGYGVARAVTRAGRRHAPSEAEPEPAPAPR